VQKQRVTKGLYYFTPERYEEDIAFQITFRALSYKELESVMPLADSGMHNLLAYQICKLAIIDIEDEYGQSHSLSTLPPGVLLETSNEILTISTIDAEEYEKLRLTIDIAFDDTFKTDSWACSTCQRKKLDRIRNCGLLGEEFQHNDFTVVVGKQVYKKCPIYELDAELLDASLESYQMYEKNFLPDEGGLYDQTKFFIVASRLVSQKLKEEEIKELKKQKKKG
jgi:hypothetical protein